MFYVFLEDYVKHIDGRRRQEAVAERLYALAKAQRGTLRAAFPALLAPGQMYGDAEAASATA